LGSFTIGLLSTIGFEFSGLGSSTSSFVSFTILIGNGIWYQREAMVLVRERKEMGVVRAEEA
jgi:hypothetical protein